MKTRDMGNGLTAAELFSEPTGWTFDDIIILPVFNPGVTTRDVKLTSPFGRLNLNFPLVSSPMDTVTNAATAIEFALHGGLGFIHMNLSIDDAVAEVQRVKRFQMGVVREPRCCSPTTPISYVAEVKRQYGFSTLLITEDGTQNSQLLGMVTKGHVAMEIDQNRPLGEIMIPRKDLVTASATEITNWQEGYEFLRRYAVAHKVPILRSDGSIAGLISRRDVVKMGSCPNALTDPDNSQLRVGAAVSTHDRDAERVEALLAASCDVILVDCAQGTTSHALKRIKQIRSHSQDVTIVAGSVVTPKQAELLIQAGADVLRDGMGSGSICTTQDVVAIGRAQLSAIFHVSRLVRKKYPHIAVIADGGNRTPADIIKGLACGASCAMLGRMVAGCDETPAKLEEHRGQRYKRYRGMGSPAALQQGGALRYGYDLAQATPVPQGVEGLIPSAGPLSNVLNYLDEAMRKALEYLGCYTIQELHECVDAGDIRFELRSASARVEGKPHDIEER